MKQQLRQIQEYIDQLSNLGYHSFQINSIIKDTVQTTRIDFLSPEQSKELLTALEEYIQFAVKCKGKNKT